MPVLRADELFRLKMRKAFCPTGPGGGVDPTCSPGASGSGGVSVDNSVLLRWVNGSPSKDDREAIRDVAIRSRTSRDRLERVERNKPTWRVGDVVDLQATSFTGVRVSKGEDAGHIGWKSSDEAIVSIRNPRRGFDIPYGDLKGVTFDASSEKETVVAGKYKVAAIKKLTEPGTEPQQGYYVPHFILEEVDASKAFCPTGQGGGVDNSCSPNQGGGGSVSSWAKSEFGDEKAPDGSSVADNFTKWFGKSVVVDDSGHPEVMYHHGSFDENTDSLAVGEEGMHFGTEDAARQRAYGKQGDDLYSELNVSQNDDGTWGWDAGPHDSGDQTFDSEDEAQQDAEAVISDIMENEQADASELGEFTKVYLSIQNPMVSQDQQNDWSAAIKKAKAGGHDGIVYQNQFEDKGSLSYIVFDASQVKSVNNDGSFKAGGEITKAFCPTGEGGGIDNSCGSGGGAGLERMSSLGFRSSVQQFTFKDKLRVVDADGRVINGKIVSKSMDGSTVMIQGRVEGTPGRKMDIFSWGEKTGLPHSIGIMKDDKPAAKPKGDSEKPELAKASVVPDDAKPFCSPSKEVVDAVNKENATARAGLEEMLGKPFAKISAEWDAKLKGMMDHARVFIRMPPDVVDKMLADGRYKSQFETNESYGGDVQQEARQGFEHVTFGVPMDTKPQDRTVYGYASGLDPHMPSKGTKISGHDGTNGYGSAIVEWRDSVKDRSTVTFGDSMNASSSVVPSPAREPSTRSLEIAIYGDEKAFVPPVIEKGTVDAASTGRASSSAADPKYGGSYTEIQIHHGAPVSDVAKVWLPKEPSAKTKGLLKARGIEWEVMK